MFLGEIEVVLFFGDIYIYIYQVYIICFALGSRFFLSLRGSMSLLFDVSVPRPAATAFSRLPPWAGRVALRRLHPLPPPCLVGTRVQYYSNKGRSIYIPGIIIIVNTTTKTRLENTRRLYFRGLIHSSPPFSRCNYSIAPVVAVTAVWCYGGP